MCNFCSSILLVLFFLPFLWLILWPQFVSNVYFLLVNTIFCISIERLKCLSFMAYALISSSCYNLSLVSNCYKVMQISVITMKYDRMPFKHVLQQHKLFILILFVNSYTEHSFKLFINLLLIRDRAFIFKAF